MKERKNNVNTLLWLVTLSVMMMLSLVCLSSCNSSVSPDGKGGKTPDDPSIPKITVTYSCSDGNGTIEAKVISSKKGKIEGNKIINLVSGDRIQFTAKPNNSYKFKEWIPKQLGNKETFELTVDKDLSVSVEFEKDDPDPDDPLDFVKKYIKFNKDDDIVYSISGLGFGKKPDDLGIYYYGYNAKNDKLMAMNVEEERKNISIFEKSGITEDFTSIRDGLEKRWLALYNSHLSSKGNWTTDNSTSDFGEVVLCDMLTSNYNMLLYKDEYDYKLYMSTYSGARSSYYLDLHIAFVKEDEPDKGYSVHFSNLVDKNGKKEYEPYLLLDAGDAKYKEYPPGAIPSYAQQKTGVHMFPLSSLIATSLKNYFEKENKVMEGFDYKNVSKSFLKEVREKNYDIYIIVGYYCSIPGDEVHCNSFATTIGGHWRNVLKFDDPIWAENQTQP